jgi:hypothetical protein
LDLYQKKNLALLMLATDIKPIWKLVGRLDQSTTERQKSDKVVLSLS